MSAVAPVTAPVDALSTQRDRLGAALDRGGLFVFDCIYDLACRWWDRSADPADPDFARLCLWGLDGLSLHDAGGPLQPDYAYLEISRAAGLEDWASVAVRGDAAVRALAGLAARRQRALLWCDCHDLPELDGFHFQRAHERTLIEVLGRSEAGWTHVGGGRAPVTVSDAVFGAIAAGADGVVVCEGGETPVEGGDFGWIARHLAALPVRAASGGGDAFAAELETAGGDALSRLRLGQHLTQPRNAALQVLLCLSFLQARLGDGRLGAAIDVWDAIFRDWETLAIQGQWVIGTRRVSAAYLARLAEAKARILAQVTETRGLLVRLCGEGAP